MKKLNFYNVSNELTLTNATIFIFSISFISFFFLYSGLWVCKFIVLNYDYSTLVSIGYPYILIISGLLSFYSLFLSLNSLNLKNTIKLVLSISLIFLCFGVMNYMYKIDSNTIASRYGQDPSELNGSKYFLFD